jgi:hypothetical protein
MPLVDRATLWLSAGDHPYIDLQIKGTQLFLSFAKSLQFLTPSPTARFAIWPEGRKAAAGDGIDLRVRDWEWWIVLDGQAEISCSHAGVLGNLWSVYDPARELQISVAVSEAEAREIHKAVKDMLAECGCLTKGPAGIFKPANKVVSYRVRSHVYTHIHGTPFPTASPQAPRLNLTG